MSQKPAIVMYTEPEIFTTDNPGSRSYIKVYVNGKRYRLYNGKPLGISCYPNHSKSVPARDKLLAQLCYQLKRKLDQGWLPEHSDPAGPRKPAKEVTSYSAVGIILSGISSEHLSRVYERDINGVGQQFQVYLRTHQLDALPISSISGGHITQFLENYKSSATNYMNRRRTLSSIFSRLVMKKLIGSNPVMETGKLKQQAYLNLPYKRDQLITVLKHMNDQHPELYLCCLLMYGCLLRPHQEIRLLQRCSFSDDLKVISLGGSQNKSRRIRTVPIPPYVRDELVKQGVDKLKDSENIFSRAAAPYNMSYFNTAWSRIKTPLLSRDIITSNHTLYSFRHTAAINMYVKTKDPFKIQQAFAHSSLRVTLTYLRNLGMVVDSCLEDLPEL